eukprot:CFRG6074T1
MYDTLNRMLHAQFSKCSKALIRPSHQCARFCERITIVRFTRNLSQSTSPATEVSASSTPPSEITRGKYVWKLVWSDEDPPPPSRDEWWGRSAGSREATTAVANYDILHDSINLPQMRSDKAKEIRNIVEVQQSTNFRQQLQNGTCQLPANDAGLTFESVGMDKSNVKIAIESGFATEHLHIESRIASALGQGFYTIGPGGEELMSIVGQVLRPTDSLALHYRHLAAQVARQLEHSGRSLDEVLLDRARGHVVSALDPVSHGRHCLIGGGKHDFLVTSTLASQAPPAVGRALGGVFANQLKVDTPFPKDFVSYVSVGDGSINNAHFLTATNLAEYTRHRGYKAPVIFGISDNGICISLKGYNWLKMEFQKKLRMPVFIADGNNVLDMWKKMEEVTAYTRKSKRPATIIFSGLARRFGHAATDRQAAYLTDEDIKEQASSNALAGLCAQAVEAGMFTYPELLKMYNHVGARARRAFDVAVNEPKITSREEIEVATSAPRVHVEGEKKKAVFVPERTASTLRKKSQVMRKHMTKVIDETLCANPDCVYIGEDVAHGGYYLVTDGLAKKYPTRVRDFPPDETALVGVGIGYSQAGLTPIVEIPYAKYLDCGADMFYEACVNNWLSHGSQPNGMLVRLQGFDKGVFGGNFHTHNTLSIPPGLDVVCYSNGHDYARGFRYSYAQAKAGRIVMSVDSTNLLNMRHLFGRDDKWQSPYTDKGDVMGWDEVRCYGGRGTRIAIVTYGNGVATSLQARHILETELGISGITVIDSPYLSAVPAALKECITNYDIVVFVDVCKQGQQPLAGHITTLQAEGLLPPRWQSVAAMNTYNPLGSTLTFTSRNDIIVACLQACGGRKDLLDKVVKSAIQ